MSSVQRLVRLAASPLSTILPLILLLLLCHSVAAQNTSCDIDQGDTKPGGTFAFSNWLKRGVCIHDLPDLDSCRVNLQAVLDSQDSLHSVEYSASATILTLLPTIGVVIGTQKAEIWMLLNVLPLGGVMAILLSFGGSTTPAKADQFTESTDNLSPATPDGNPGASKPNQNDQSSPVEQLSTLVSEKIQGGQQKELPLRKILVILLTMVVLLAADLVGMGIIEYGSVYVSWCTSFWWFHLWFITLTVVAVADAWASLPFDHYTKLYLSDVRNDLHVQGGSNIFDDSDSQDCLSKAGIVDANLKQLNTLKSGELKVTGSYQSAQSQNRLLVIVSIARDTKNRLGPKTSLLRSGLQVFFKIGAVTIYVFATSIFSAVTLLALPMAQMILTLVVGSGMLGNVLATMMVSMAKQHNSFRHVMASSDQEAAEYVARIFEDQRRQGTRNKFQIEIDGHVFVDQVRITSRSPWPRRLLGVFAKPYDLAHSVSGNMAWEGKGGDSEVREMVSV